MPIFSDGKEENLSKRFRIYIDESGDHTYHNMSNPEKRYLGLMGCIFETNYYRDIFQIELEKLKRKYFQYDPDEPLIFHRKEIINKNGPFYILNDAQIESNFNRDLLNLFGKSEYKIISVVIDKYAHFLGYSSPFHPYHYCLAVILERYCIYLNYLNARGDALAESRGGQEDLQLKEAYRRVYNSGTRNQSEENFQRALTSCEIKLKPKSKNIAGLQLADLLAYPIKQEILLEEKRIEIGEVFGKKVCEVIQDKYCRHLWTNEIKGCGKIFLAKTIFIEKSS